MRPSAPSSFYTPFIWAAASSFPAGSEAWSGQPLKSLPLKLYFEPGETQPAEEMNYVLNAMAADQDNVQDYFETVLDYVGQLQLQNWTYAMSAYDSAGGTNGGIITKPYWSDYHGCWVYVRRRYQSIGAYNYDEPETNLDAGIINDGEANASQFLPFGLDVNNGGPIDTQTVRVWAFAVNPTGEPFAICSDGNVYFDSGYASNNPTQLDATAGEQSELHYFGGRFVLFAGKGSYTQAQFTTSIAGDGTAWNAAQNVTAALQPTNSWAVAKSADRLIAIPNGLTNVFTYLKMDTSHTVTYGTLPSPPAGYKLGCVAYLGDDTWLMTLDNGTNATNVYRSTDNGDTWTLVKTFSKVAVYMAGNGGGTALMLYGSSAAIQALWTKDAGSTWYRSSLRALYVPPVSSASRTVKSCIVVADHQIVVATYQGIQGSLIAGTPAAEDTY